MSYQLGNIEQCYLPGKMADNMHSHKKSNHFMSILPPALFLHSPPHIWVIKCLDFLPSIHISILQLARHNVWILFIFYILHFSLHRSDEATKQRCVTHNKRQDGIRKCQCCFEETCSNNISPCAEICIVPCKKCK